jgi:hypothetical protein
MALTSFADVQTFLNKFCSDHSINITGAQHGVFWNNSTGGRTPYDNFINGDVPNVQDPNGNPLPILNKINGKYDGPSSNLVMALNGDSPLFTKSDPNAPIGQMPYNGPYMSADQIGEISAWITAQCPE